MNGILIDIASVALGGLCGFIIKDKLSNQFKIEMNLIFGICSMAMGINSIILMENMPAVVFSVVLGSGIGLVLHLGEGINKVSKYVVSKLFHSSMMDDDYFNQLVTVIVLFCASGTGIYGSLVLGMTGDSSILVSKAILDFFTAMIFACNLGLIVSLISIPQFLIMFLLFLSANIILPMTSLPMIQDFKACGGVLMLATGFRICKIKNFPIADMLPAMVLIFPISYFWMNVIMTLI
ncbi:MAG: DUF554 domain-containing protein [Traorella sp.]